MRSGANLSPVATTNARPQTLSTRRAGVRSILKMIFPPLVAMSTDAKVSGNCSGAILKWILNLRNLRTWAVQMLDSIGKPSAGILEGSLTMFGNYKQCLGVRAPDEDEIEVSDDGEFKEYFRGQYCVVQVRPPLAKKPAFYSLNSTITSLLRKSYKYYERTVYDDLSELAMAFHFVSIRLDLCVPSLCSRDDIQRVANFRKYANHTQFAGRQIGRRLVPTLILTSSSHNWPYPSARQWLARWTSGRACSAATPSPLRHTRSSTPATCCGR